MSFKETSFIFILLLSLPKARTLDFQKQIFLFICFVLFLRPIESLLATRTIYFQTHVYLNSSSPSVLPRPGRTMFFFLKDSYVPDW